MSHLSQRTLERIKRIHATLPLATLHFGKAGGGISSVRFASHPLQDEYTFDLTWLESTSNSQFEIVLAHELGHYTSRMGQVLSWDIARECALNTSV